MILLDNDIFSLFASRAKTLVKKAAVRSLDTSAQTFLSSGSKIPLGTAEGLWLLQARSPGLDRSEAESSLKFSRPGEGWGPKRSPPALPLCLKRKLMAREVTTPASVIHTCSKSDRVPTLVPYSPSKTQYSQRWGKLDGIFHGGREMKRGVREALGGYCPCHCCRQHWSVPPRGHKRG